MMGPNAIIDKSFLQMLNPEEVFEFSLFFRPVIVPVLIREIISDLKKEPTAHTVPHNVVKALASKLGNIHGLTPVNFRKAAIGNLLTRSVPLTGQVPVDADAPNVHISRSGKGLLYDSAPEQKLWDRWAAGNFNTSDELSATVWRQGIERIRLDRIRDDWKDFVQEHFASAKSIPSLVQGVNALFADFSLTTQREVLQTTLGFLRVAPGPGTIILMLSNAGLIPRIGDLAPYAASVARLAFVFVAGLGRGFIGPRPSHYLDLQYLFYAPFANVFVSSDKFHRDLWVATSGNNTFVWGPDLKADLARRIALRKQQTQSEREKHDETHGFYPLEIDGSPITKVWGKYLRPRNEILGSAKDRKALKESEPEILKEIHERLAEFDTFPR
ncbi:MAG: hypothetical protein LAO76_18175 [Acidobacteriia bacterium]|nr:hypothetical protein [Terriglobia bacterium]